jgi:hypothetical protein
MVPEQVKARHILIKVGDGQTEDQAQKKLVELKKDLNVKNFGELAKKYSDDPGSKDKGGELGFFSKGHMVPAFEQAAFSLPIGQISEPVKTDYGYHLILVEEKKEGGQKSFDAVKEDVTREYLARRFVDEKLTALQEQMKKPDLKEAEATLRALKVAWKDVKSVSLAADQIPGLRTSEEALRTLATQKGQLGLVPEIKEWNGERFVFDLTSWKSKAAKEPKKETVADNSSERLAGDAFQKWVMSLSETVSIERNAQLFQ